METTTIRIIHDDKAITSFVREQYEYSEYDVPWHEVPVVSEHWKATDAKIRISEEKSQRGAPKGMLDRQQHHPRYYGLPHLDRGDTPAVKLLDGPTQWSWEDGKSGFSMPRDGDRLPGGESLIRIKYNFPDGGQPIWHRNVAAALDLLAEQSCQDVPLPVLRRVINEKNRSDTPRR
ncbi:hypothetical protein PJI20_27535 [Mycobacterium kansasii]